MPIKVVGRGETGLGLVLALERAPPRRLVVNELGPGRMVRHHMFPPNIYRLEAWLFLLTVLGDARIWMKIHAIMRSACLISDG
jgi:hypothetical protein